jgi:hypothetical protein
LPRSDTRITGYHSTIQCYNPARGNSGLMAPVIDIMDVRNVQIEGLEVDGRRSAWTFKTEWKPGFNIEGSTDVHLHKCVSHDNKGDGVAVSTMTPNKHNRNVTVTESNLDNNHRGSLFIGECKRGRFTGNSCRGNTGTSPMFGIDIEPDGNQSIVEDIHIEKNDLSGNGTEDKDGAGFYVTVKDKIHGFVATGGTRDTVTVGVPMIPNQYRNCVLRWLTGNNRGEEQYIVEHTENAFTLAEATTSVTTAGNQFEILPRQRQIRVLNNHIEDNGIQGVIFYHARDVTFRGNTVNNNGNRGMEIRGNSENLLFDGNAITRNDRDCVAFGFNPGRTITNVRFVNNYLRGRLDGGDGIELLAGNILDGVIFDNNDIGDVAHGYNIAGTLTNAEFGKTVWGTVTGSRFVGVPA